MNEKSSETMTPLTGLENIRRKILVLSGKGGVGKSTVAANLAASLAKLGKKTGLLDADLHGPSITGMFGLQSRQVGIDGNGMPLPIEVMPNLDVISMGLLLKNKHDAVVWRGPMKYNVIKQFLHEIDWGELDCLVVDSPPGTGDEPLAVAQLVGDNASAVVVTTPQELAVSDVRRSISFCKTLNIPILGIIENMSGFCCPHCGNMTNLFSSGGGEMLAAETKLPLLGSIPFDPGIVTRGDSGKGFTENSNNDAFSAIADKIMSPMTNDNHNHSTNEVKKMKIAIPTAGKKLCLHFGHCEEFAVLEVDESSKKVLKKEYLTPPPHEPGVLPKWLHEQGVNVIIAGGMGQRAQGLFNQNNITVVVGAEEATPEELAAAYLDQTLKTGNNVCDH